MVVCLGLTLILLHTSPKPNHLSDTVIDTLGIFEVAAALGDGSLGAYVISQCQQVSHAYAFRQADRQTGLYNHTCTDPPTGAYPMGPGAYLCVRVELECAWACRARVCIYAMIYVFVNVSYLHCCWHGGIWQAVDYDCRL